MACFQESRPCSSKKLTVKIWWTKPAIQRAYWMLYIYSLRSTRVNFRTCVLVYDCFTLWGQDLCGDVWNESKKFSFFNKKNTTRWTHSFVPSTDGVHVVSLHFYCPYVLNFPIWMQQMVLHILKFSPTSMSKNDFVMVRRWNRTMN